MGKQKNIAIPPIKPLELTKISKGKWAGMNRLFKEVLKQTEGEERQLEKERWKPKKQKIGKCQCGGLIVISTTYTSEHNPNPASREQFRRVRYSSCFCEECGIVYNPEIVQKMKRFPGNK